MPKAEIVVKKVNGKNKKFTNDERLKYYPTGMPLFSASRGMKRPVVEKISNKEAMERVSDTHSKILICMADFTSCGNGYFCFDKNY